MSTLHARMVAWGNRMEGTSGRQRKQLMGVVALLLAGYLLWDGITFTRHSTADSTHARPAASHDVSEDVAESAQITEAIVQAAPQMMPICHSQHSEGRYDNLQMDAATCDTEFGPVLWSEIDAATQYHRKRGGITAKDAEDAEADSTIRLKILDGQLYIKKYIWAPASRALAAIHAVHQAIITSPEQIQDLDFSISLLDAGPPSASRWVLDRKDDDIGAAWLMPDFGLWSWPEPYVGGWRDFRCRVNEVERGLKWSDKRDVLFWRGVAMSPNRREIIKKAAGQSWGDVLEINWGEPEKSQGERIAMQDHCKYRYLAQAEGFAYSGRLKYLLMCSSVIVSHRMEYTQHFHSLFDADPASPHRNMVILNKTSWDGIEKVMSDLQLQDQSISRRIAENSRKIFTKYLSPAANQCYWRRALQAYASLQAGQVPQSLEGWLDYESFVLAGTMNWGPH